MEKVHCSKYLLMEGIRKNRLATTSYTPNPLDSFSIKEIYKGLFGDDAGESWTRISDGVQESRIEFTEDDLKLKINIEEVNRRGTAIQYRFDFEGSEAMVGYAIDMLKDKEQGGQGLLRKIIEPKQKRAFRFY